MDTKENIKTWIDTLTEEELKTVLLNTVTECINLDVVRLCYVSKKPCWDHNSQYLSK